jgi:hypothetical protein
VSNDGRSSGNSGACSGFAEARVPKRFPPIISGKSPYLCRNSSVEGAFVERAAAISGGAALDFILVLMFVPEGGIAGRPESECDSWTL